MQTLLRDAGSPRLPASLPNESTNHLSFAQSVTLITDEPEPANMTNAATI
jgi:hypothetical protein